MLARHLIGLSFCLEKATRQLCLHLSCFTRFLVAVEDILLVVDACRRARHLEPAADFKRSSWQSAYAAPVRPLPCILPNFSGFSVPRSHALFITCEFPQIWTFVIPLCQRYSPDVDAIPIATSKVLSTTPAAGVSVVLIAIVSDGH